MSDQHNGLILVIEEATESFDLVKKAMGSHYSCKHVSNSTSALSLCTLLLPDIILINTKLPELNGFDLCSRLNSISITAKIPVIFLLDSPSVQDELTAFLLEPQMFSASRFSLKSYARVCETVWPLNTNMTVRKISFPYAR